MNFCNTGAVSALLKCFPCQAPPHGNEQGGRLRFLGGSLKLTEQKRIFVDVGRRYFRMVSFVMLINDKTQEKTGHTGQFKILNDGLKYWLFINVRFDTILSSLCLQSIPLMGGLFPNRRLRFLYWRTLLVYHFCLKRSPHR